MFSLGTLLCNRSFPIFRLPPLAFLLCLCAFLDSRYDRSLHFLGHRWRTARLGTAGLCLGFRPCAWVLVSTHSAVTVLLQAPARTPLQKMAAADAATPSELR